MNWENCKNNYYNDFISNARINNVIIFGASSAGINALHHLKSIGIEVIFFCDNDNKKWGNKLFEVEIISPKELLNRKGDSIILIASDYHREIRKQLIELKVKDIYYFSKFGLFDNILYDSQYIWNNTERIGELFTILADEKSKKAVENILKYRLNCKVNYLDEIYYNEPIFKKEFINLNNFETFVDAGAYDGDTILEIIKDTNGMFDKIYAFEPDERNYEKLVKVVDICGYKNQIEVLKLGLYDSNKVVNFNSNLTNSSIDKDGTQQIEVARCDEVLKDKKVTYIKMDIEGAEFKALKGSENIILKQKPKLAICIYHTPTDLWELPLYIKKLLPDYKIYIRQNTNEIVDTVCYAII